MLVLSGKDIGKSYGTDIILEDVSFVVNRGDRIGIVGANGSGKTTLLNIIAGGLEPSSGTVSIRNDVTVGYLRQRGNFFSEGTVIEEARRSFSHLFAMEKELDDLQLSLHDHESKDFDRNLARYTELIEDLIRMVVVVIVVMMMVVVMVVIVVMVVVVIIVIMVMVMVVVIVIMVMVVVVVMVMLHLSVQHLLLK